MKSKKFYILFVLFILLLTCGCVLSTSQKSANLILYPITERDEDYKDVSKSMYTVNPKDGQLKKLFDLDVREYGQALFSPDGSKVVLLSYHTVERAGTTVPGASFSLVTIDSDGENAVTWYKDRETKTLGFGSAVTAQFSADGKRFFYTRPASAENNEVELYTARPDGTDEILIDQDIIAAEFSPKGDRLLVTRRIRDDVNKKTTWEVYYVDAKGGDAEIVWSTEEKGIVSVLAKYAQDDQVLLAVGNLISGEVELSLASDDFKEITSIVKFPEVSTTFLTQSPDGKYIALGRHGDDCTLFSVINVATGDIHDVSCWEAYPYQFASNGKYLLQHTLGDYGDFQRVGLSQMLLEPDGDLIEILPYPDYIHSTLSPDGNQMAYWSRDKTTKETCLNIRDLETDEVTTLDETCVDGATYWPGITDWK